LKSASSNSNACPAVSQKMARSHQGIERSTMTSRMS
jgi:hypothetical protein